MENQKVKNWGWGWTIIWDSRVHKQINISLFFQLFSLFFIVSAWKDKEIWLHDEIINSFLYMLTKKTDVPYIAAQLQHLLWRKKNRSENFGKMRVCYLSLSFSFPSIQTTLDFSCRKHIWRAIGVLDLLATDTHWTDTSVQRGYRIGLSLMQMKFGLTYVKQVNIRLVKQPDNSSCGVMVCYYAEQIVNGNVFLYVFWSIIHKWPCEKSFSLNSYSNTLKNSQIKCFTFSKNASCKQYTDFVLKYRVCKQKILKAWKVSWN